MYAHLYTLTQRKTRWDVTTNGTDVRELGYIEIDTASEKFHAFVPMDGPYSAYVGTCTNLIAAADLLYDVDRAMTHPTKPEHDHTAHQVTASEWEIAN